jgi:signal transduction histidine kinase
LIAPFSFHSSLKQWTCCALIFLISLKNWTFAAETNAPVTTCAGVLDLFSAPETETHPVHLHAVVTCYVPSAQLCFVQDQTAGVYAFPKTWSGDFAFGEVVEVDGWSGKGRFSPVVHTAVLRSAGERTKPTARRVALEDINNGQFDSQFVALEGVVQTVDFTGGVCSLKLWNAGSSVRVLGFSFKSSPTNLIDASVRAEGVGGTFYDNNRLTGFGLFLQGPDQLQILSAAPEQSQTPVRTATTLASYLRNRGLDHRVRVRGIVTVAWPGEALFLQDEAGPLRVEAARKEDEGITAGERVEACGFVRNITGIPDLGETSLRRLGLKTIPEPHFLTIKDVLSQPPAGQFIITEGSVLNVRTLPEIGWRIIEIERDSQSLNALCPPDKAAEVRRGSRIRLTGAWSAAPRRLRDQLGPMLWINSAASLLLLAPAQSTVAPGLAGNTHFWIGLSAAALILVAIAAAVARRNGLRLAALQSAGSHRQLDSEREIQRLQDARERLGRDLHDRIIQSIYAVGLNIDDCARHAQADPGNIEARLRSALKEINAVIGELRNVILGLETNAIQPRELRTALKSLALALGHEESNRIRIATDEDALAALTPAQATELVHIAREALSNSVRHGAASTTSFRVELRSENIRFTIEDDGHGFDVKSAEGKGYGLRNMAKRAAHLEAKFSIHSQEGNGTRVVLDIPRQRQHF